MYACAARLHRNAPLRCTPITVSQSSSDILKSRLSRVTPALLTRISGRHVQAAHARHVALSISQLHAMMTWSLHAGHTPRANQRAMPCTGRQDQAISGSQVYRAYIASCIAHIGQREADRAAYTIQYFLVVVAVHRVAIAGPIRPAIG